MTATHTINLTEKDRQESILRYTEGLTKQETETVFRVVDLILCDMENNKELRARAIDFAIRTALGAPRTGLGANTVVTMADAYYKYLKDSTVPTRSTRGTSPDA